MRRAIILKSVIVTSLHFADYSEPNPPSDGLAPAESNRVPTEIAERVRQTADLLKNTEVWRDVEPGEREYFEAGTHPISQRMRIDASWLVESLACLLWALQLIPVLPPYDQEIDLDLIKFLPAEPIAQLIGKARLRGNEEIKAQRDLAELWHWRARTRRLQEEGRLAGKLFGGQSIEQIISTAAANGAKNRLFDPVSGDFPAMGKPYRDLSREEFATMTSIAQERHKAMNWLCGLSPTGRWHDTSTDT